jgi:hypothetical protein
MMYYDVVSAEYVGDYKLKLSFANGKSGIVDLSDYVKKGGVFRKLADLENFKKFEINHELGVITWDNEIDIAPETLYSEATKTALPQWVEKEGLKRTA